MDAHRFDRLATTLAAGTRRTMLSWLTALPLAAALSARLAEPDEAAGRRKKRQCARAGQTLKKGKRKKCCAGLSKDASGRCAAPQSPPPPSPPPPPCTGLTPTNTSPTKGLQEAISVAASGATLTLCAGTW